MRQLTPEPVALRKTDTADWRLWGQLAELARHLDPEDWVLVGGQMVALHAHIAGILPVRTSRDIDLVANVLAKPGALARCRAAAADLELEPFPSSDGKRLQPVRQRHPGCGHHDPRPHTETDEVAARWEGPRADLRWAESPGSSCDRGDRN